MTLPAQNNSTVHLKIDAERLNIANCADFQTKGKSLLGNGASHLSIDLSDVEFIDSSGIGALVSLRKAMGSDGRVTLSSPSDFVLRVLKITELDRYFEVQR